MKKENKMEYLSRQDLETPGYYWWLPSCDIEASDKPESWSIVSFHPQNDQFRYNGLFSGPLKPPVNEK